MATLEEYARLSALVYGPDVAAGATDMGWQVAETPAHAPMQLSTPSGYYGAVFVNPGTGEYVLASRGSNSVVDWVSSNVQMGAGQPPAQLSSAQILLDLAVNAYGVPREHLSLTGHSLGGSLAQMLTVIEGVPSTTFNAFPVKRVVPTLGGDPDASYRITDVVHQGDIVSSVGPHLGTRIILSNRDPFPAWGMTPFGVDPEFQVGLLLARAARLGLTAHGIDPIVAKLRAAATLPCPLALDLDGDGVETTSLAMGPYFDHDADGFAERTGWIGRDDGLLVRDRDGDGVIASGRELFGNHTLLAGGAQAANGYAALAELDANGDGKIDASDPAFASLRVWRDANGNGRSEPEELLGLQAAGVASVRVNATPSSVVDAAGNAHLQVGSFTRVGGGTGATADVWFQSSRVDSLAVDWVALPASFAGLPDAVGSGQVRDLLQAAARDSVLEGLVRDFAAEADPARRTARLDGVVYRWAGVDGLDPADRGGLIDARQLATLERFAAEPFAGRPGANPAPAAADALTVAYRDLAELIYAELMMTTRLGDLYGLVSYTWDEASGTVRADLGAVVHELDARLAADPAGATGTLAELARTLRGLEADAVFDFDAFHDHFAARGGDIAWAVEKAGRLAIDGTAAGDVLTAGPGAVAIRGRGGADQIAGGAGADVLWGDDGADQLSGGAGDDLLDGGSGNDVLDGGPGNDTYAFGRGGGRDTVNDYDWQLPSIDRIRMAPDVAPADVSVRRVESHLVLAIAGTADEILLTNWFLEGFGSAFQVQRVEFADGTAWDIASLRLKVLDGTDGPDVLLGTSASETLTGRGGNDQLDGGGGDDLLQAGAGDDSLQGAAGNDVLDGGPGNDSLDGGVGSDTYLFGRGAGQDTITDRDWAVPSIDRVLLGADVSPAQVTVRRAGNALVLGIAGTPDTVSITDWFLEGFGSDYQVQRVEFADGTAWDVPALKQLATAIVGTGGPDTLTGTAAPEMLRGLAGDDQLFGRGGDDLLDGGPGADRLAGESGNDTYVVDDPGDVVTEAPGQGTDTVQSSVSHALGANVERLWLTGAAAIDGTGNDLANALTGNAAANVLDGGLGADTMTGGAGGDTYAVDDAGDVVAEVAGEGIDTVRSRVAYTLPVNVERLVLLGTAAIAGTGNALDNMLTGNAGANALAGGAGNDTYVIGAGDTVSEAAGGGIDEVLSPIAYALPANVENLTLTGAAAVNGTGNDLANTLAGNAGNNVLAGGKGNDTYRFGRGGGQDTVVETDTTPGNTDAVAFDAGLAPLDLVLSRSGKDLRLAVHGSADAVVVKDWYKGSAPPVEIFQAAGGPRLVASQVALLVQDIAGYSARTGLSWDQAIDQRPADVQTILAAHWQPA